MLAMTAMKFAAPHQLLFDKPVEKNYCQPESVSKTNPSKPCRVVELDLGRARKRFRPCQYETCRSAGSCDGMYGSFQRLPLSFTRILSHQLQQLAQGSA